MLIDICFLVAAAVDGVTIDARAIAEMTCQPLAVSSSITMPICSTINTTGGGSSTASSRDTSPCRELSPLVTNLKPPIIIRRELRRGIGFTVHTIRVYYGDTDFYTMHHLVMAVDEKSAAYGAGLRPADLITVNFPYIYNTICPVSVMQP